MIMFDKQSVGGVKGSDTIYTCILILIVLAILLSPYFYVNYRMSKRIEESGRNFESQIKAMGISMEAKIKEEFGEIARKVEKLEDEIDFGNGNNFLFEGNIL